MFYKSVHFARKGQESVSLRFMMETQWCLGSGGTAVPSLWDSRSSFARTGGSGNLCFSVPHLSISTGRAAKGGCTCRCGVLWLEGHLISSGRLMTAGSSAARGDGKKSRAPWRQQCKTKWLWMEQFTGNIFHLQLHVEVISPNELKLLENCKSNGK